MKKVKSVLGIILCLSLLMTTTVFAAEVPANSQDEIETLINSYWSDISNGEWNHWVNNYSPTVRNEYQQLVSRQDNFKNNIGILTVKSAQVLSINHIANEFIPETYKDMIPSLLSGEDCSSYIVDVRLDVITDNGYFKDGLNTFLFTTSKANGIPYINAVSSWENTFTRAEALGYGFQEYAERPTKITVRYADGKTIETIDFDKFVFVTTCNEVGNEGYKAEAIKANAMAIQMCGRWAKKGKFFPVGGYDVYYGYVAIDSTNHASSANQKTVQSAVDAVKNNEVLSSGGKLFSMNYYAGTYGDSGKESGQMRQNGSSYLADNGYDWKGIIKYYYNNSAYNNGGVGTIKIN